MIDLDASLLKMDLEIFWMTAHFRSDFIQLYLFFFFLFSTWQLEISL